MQLQILRSLPLKDFLNFGSTGSGVSISDDSIKLWLQERLAGTENFQENVQRFISRWMELRPFQGAFAERVRHVLENLTPKGHMTLGQFGEFVENMLKLKPPKFLRDYDWVTNEELLKFFRDLPISLMNIFLPLSWKEVDDSNTIDILIGMSYKNQDLFKNLVSHLPPLKDWKFLISPNTYKIGLLLGLIEKNDPTRFLELVSQLPLFENWDSPELHGDNIKSTFSLLKQVSVLNKTLFLHLVKNLKPEDDSKDPIHVLIKECREEMAAMPGDPKS